MKMQEQLARVVAEYKAPTPFDWPLFMKKYSKDQSKVLVMPNLELQYSKDIPTNTGWNLMVGKEQLFSAAFWWDLGFMERGSILVNSVGHFTQVGLISYFLDLYDSQKQRKWAADFAAAGESAKMQVSLDKGSRITLKDGLVSESFVLFQYGMSVSVAGFAAEIISKLCLLLVAALRHRIVPHLRSMLSRVRVKQIC